MPPSLFLTLLLTVSLWAMKPDPCDNLTNTKMVVKCALAQNDGIRAAKLDIAQAKANYQAAAGFINPELEGEFLLGGGSTIETEFAALFTIELGGKRYARRELAKSQQETANLTLRQKKEDLAIATILGLYQLRQIKDEFRLLNDSLRTFQNQIKQYESVARLDAEREMALSIFKLSAPEIQLHLNEHMDEKRQILGNLEVALGQPLNLVKIKLPEFNTAWKTLTPAPLASAKYALAELIEQQAGSSLALERANAFPNLSLGPIFGMSGPLTGAEKFEFAGGLAFSIDLPILNLNLPAIRAAKIEMMKDKIKARYEKDLEAQELQILHKDYEVARQAMTAMLSEEDIWGRHDYFHKQIDRGMVSAPIVIELHRQIMNYYETRNEHELKLAKAYWKIKALEGTLLQEVEG